MTQEQSDRNRLTERLALKLSLAFHHVCEHEIKVAITKYRLKTGNRDPDMFIAAQLGQIFHSPGKVTFEIDREEYFSIAPSEEFIRDQTNWKTDPVEFYKGTVTRSD